MTGHRVSTEAFLVIPGFQIKEPESLPIAPVLVFDVKTGEGKLIPGNVELDISPGLEIQILARRQVYDEFLYERGDILI